MGEILNKARKYEQDNISKVTDDMRPAYHVTGGIGWINDPNGFSVYKGEYHLFYQYHPYSTQWGPMHWGHVKTKDFVKWERLPIAIGPDTAPDQDGCFSGSAIELEDGRQLLLYTGVIKSENKDDPSNDIQHQCVAVGDGINYEKYDGNPVIEGDTIPENGNIHDFRDPKIWRENGQYYAVMVNRAVDGSGVVLRYESEDGFSWKFKDVLERCHNEYGNMWECPDYFELDGKRVLVVSTIDMQAKGYEFHPGNGVLFFVGTEDEEGKFEREYVQSIDCGLDYYAPQSLLTDDGRRVMIAWMQNWATCNHPIKDSRIFGEMTFPREITIRGNRVYQNPVREIENYHRNKVEYKNILVNKEISLEGVEGRVIDMTVTLHTSKDNRFSSFNIKLAKDGAMYTDVTYEPSHGILRIDRSRCGFPYDIVNIREFEVSPINDELKLRFLLDKHSMELFVNDGQKTATSYIYTPQDARDITFYADGDAYIYVEKYELEV